MANTYNFKLSATKPQNKVKRTRDYIDYLSLEIHGERPLVVLFNKVF